MDADLQFIRSSLETLEDFLLSKEIFFPLDSQSRMAGSSAISRLSLGGLLLALQRVKAIQGSSFETAEASGLIHQVEELRERWRSHWTQKARKEYSSRLSQWKNSLSDLAEEDAGTASAYSREVRLRTILTLLAQEADHIDPQEDALLFSLDQKLRSRFQSGSFLWDSALAPGFPADSFWYLYGTIRPRASHS